MRANEYAELAAFVAIAEERSFRRAAERLNLKPSTLSHSLRSLEARLGVSLVSRTTRTVSPTEAGSALLAQIAPAFSGIESAVESINAFRSHPQGRVRINVPSLAAELVLAPRLGRFVRLYPDVVLEVTVDNRFVDIVGSGYDAGIRLGESLQQDMVAVRLTGELRAAVVGSPDYFERHPPPLAPQDLYRHRCINRRYGANGPLYRWEFEKEGKSLNILVDGPLILDQDAMMIRAAVDGAGLACVAAIDAAEDTEAGRLVRVLEDWCPPIEGFFLYYPRHRQSSASLRALIEVLRAPA
jgi:DNA-binding transcriptional LysR family regulator